MTKITGYASIPRSVLHDESLPTGAKIVLLVLSSYVGTDDTAWPSHATIARLAGMSERSVRRHLLVLKAADLITWVQQKSASGDLTSNLYRLLDPSGVGTAKLSVPTDTVAPGGDMVAEERTSKNEKKKTARTGDPESFEEFWKAYPRRDDRGHAVTAYKRALHQTEAETLLEAARSFAAFAAAARTERQFIPLGATWLNGQRWLDDYTPEPEAQAAGWWEAP